MEGVGTKTDRYTSVSLRFQHFSSHPERDERVFGLMRDSTVSSRIQEAANETLYRDGLLNRVRGDDVRVLRRGLCRCEFECRYSRPSRRHRCVQR